MAADTNIESLFETLLEDGVLEASADGENVRVTRAFDRSREEVREKFAAGADEDYEAEATAFLADTDLSVADLDRELVADAMAVHDVCDSLGVEESVRVADSLDRIETTMAESGVPAGFVSVAGEEIEGFLASHPASILYFWREDCDPCDELKAGVEGLVREGRIPEEFGLGAVYGPDCPAEILSAYDVGAAPTTLFCEGTRVGSRFVGYPGVDPFASEIEILATQLES